MKGIGNYVVIYDISKNSERRTVNKTLKEFGFRIQKSVFECKMNKVGKMQLIRRLEKLNIKTGFIKIYKEEYSLNEVVIGNSKKESNVDDDNVYMV
ncbi:MAG: CRISPR-associated endonuclease Cas2 [Fusobacteriia bacterium 4572_132]|nr:MAG: CRISPR-associated endonuclease Cas2 [Fusobacteriia bacterium 4572_132]